MPDPSPVAGPFPRTLVDLLPAPHRAKGRELIGSRLTYEQAFHGSLHVARELLDLGGIRGRPVVVDLANGPLFVAAFFGVLRAGGIAVLGRSEGFVEASGSPAALSICAPEGPRTEAVSDPSAEALEIGVSGVGSPRVVRPFAPGSREDPDELQRMLPRLEPGDEAVVLFTSGSEGWPKGVAKTHHNLLVELELLDEFFGREARRFLSMLPWSYVYGLIHHLLLPMRRGATVELLGSFTPRSALEAVRSRKIDVLVAVPSVLRALSLLTDLPPRLGLRWAVTSGDRIDDATVERLARTGLRLIEVYGSTETGALTIHPDRTGHPRAAGLILPYLDVSVDRRGSVPAPTDAAGEQVGVLKVRGPSVSARVFQNGQWRSALDRQGWMTLEDEARLCADGSLHLVQRASRSLKVDGHRVSLDEIEQVVLGIPAVLDAAAFGKPDPIHGEIPVVHVVTAARSHWTERTLREECARHLPAHARPRSLHIVERIEREGRAKVRAPSASGGHIG